MNRLDQVGFDKQGIGSITCPFFGLLFLELVHELLLPLLDLVLFFKHHVRVVGVDWLLVEFFQHLLLLLLVLYEQVLFLLLLKFQL